MEEISLKDLSQVKGIGEKTLNRIRDQMIKKGSIKKKSISQVGFPNKKYDVIYADPPWRYEENWGNGSNEHTYNTMSVEDIQSLPVEQISKDECHLYLWFTNPFVSEALEVMKSWGFKQKTIITWRKLYKDGTPEMGMGYYFRGCTEHILFGVRGKKKSKSKEIKNHFDAVNPRWFGYSHSTKPEKARELIKEVSGVDSSKIELFARKKIEGWDVWGKEVN